MGDRQCSKEWRPFRPSGKGCLVSFYREEKMKKVFIQICVACGLLSCAKPAAEIPADTPVSFALDVVEAKADHDSWISGDVIHVFFNGIGEKYVSLEFDGHDWNLIPSGSFVQGDFASLESKILTAVYLPVSVDISYADDGFSFSRNGENVFNYYLYEQFSYVLEGTTITSTLSMGKKETDYVVFCVQDLQADADAYTLSCPLIRPVACKRVLKDGTVVEEALQAGARLPGTAFSEGAFFAGRPVKPGEKSDYSFSLASNKTIYTLGQEGLSLSAATIHNLPSPAKGWTAADVSDLFVDLGLSIRWANCNVGAAAETEAGDFFSWGEINGYNSGKRNFSDGDYLFGPADKLSRYTGSDYVTLLKEDDAAYASLGGKIRIPTYAEWEELMNNCNWEWKDNGYRVSGKKAGFTDKSIFLPVTGFWMNSESPEMYKVVGCYWSSSLYDKSSDRAWYADLQPSQKGFSAFFRRYGCAVRPVMGGNSTDEVQDYYHHDYTEK